MRAKRGLVSYRGLVAFPNKMLALLIPWLGNGERLQEGIGGSESAASLSPFNENPGLETASWPAPSDAVPLTAHYRRWAVLSHRAVCHWMG